MKGKMSVDKIIAESNVWSCFNSLLQKFLSRVNYAIATGVSLLKECLLAIIFAMTIRFTLYNVFQIINEQWLHSECCDGADRKKSKTKKHKR